MALRQRASGVARKVQSDHGAPPARRDVDNDGKASTRTSSMANYLPLRRQPVWIILAVASGGCAAVNGVFAKLTTTAQTSTLASHVSHFLHLVEHQNIVEYIVRASFFGLNLLFNALMWGLFTAALARGDSTTRVSIVNVSANFVVTAVLGWAVFGEKLPWLWWIGAALLAAGNVVIGRREEVGRPGSAVGLQEAEDLLLREDNLVDLDQDVRYSVPKEVEEQQVRTKKGEEVDAPT